MRFALTGVAWIGLAVSTECVPLLAQLQDNSEKQGIPGFKWLHGLAGGRREWIWFGRNPG